MCAECQYSRIQHLAMSVFMGRWRDSLMAMFTVYFDASGSPDEGVALSVAGFIATVEQWIEFERNWKTALDDYGVSELHMKTFAPGAGEFASWKDDKHRRRLFLERLISIIKVRVRHSFVNCVMLQPYQRVSEAYPLLREWKPFALAGNTCIDKVKNWAHLANMPMDRIHIVFEDGDKHKGCLMDRCEAHHGFVPNFLKKKQSCAFQAADLLAYEHRRANETIFGAGVGILSMSDLRHSLQALDDIPHGKDGEDWGVSDGAALVRFCELNKYPKSS
jgi:hypothetical protein